MGIYIPSTLPTVVETNLAATSLALRRGTAVTAGTPAHTKNATYTTLIAATSRPSYGMWIRATESAGAAAVTNFLLSLAIGTAGNEIEIAQDFQIGQAAGGTGGNGGRMFPVPLYVPSGVRLSATAQRERWLNHDVIDVCRRTLC